MPTNLEHERWLGVAANLRVDRKDNIAPHKPLLLLVVADLAERGLLPHPDLPLTGELTFRFLAYWTIVAHRRTQRPEIWLPFYHMKRDGCWTPLDEDGKATTERRSVVAARLNDDFYLCLHDSAFRKEFRLILIAKYFVDPNERAALYDLVGIAIPSDDEIKSDTKKYAASRQTGREAKFRLAVVPSYDYTCALTGYRCLTVDLGSIVDAAHIHQFASSRNNDPRNGIALSKNAHWMFDQGIWSADDDYRVILAPDRFDEAGDDSYLLKRMAGRELLLPRNSHLWPAKEYFHWHRRQHRIEPT
jgi:putative restriction endonuclease